VGPPTALRLTSTAGRGEVLLAVTDELLAAGDSAPPVLLVADRLGGRQLLRSLHAGVVSFLPRRSTDLAAITILKDLLSRHNLRNRAHAVAYGLKIGPSEAAS
jgi:hypothetical protein